MLTLSYLNCSSLCLSLQLLAALSFPDTEIMASTVPTCSRCKRTGHVAVECSQPFFRTCAYCKEMGHAVKSCPKLFAKKAALDDSSSTVSTSSRSTAVTAATSVSPATPSKDGKANGRKPRQRQKAPVPPKIQFLSEAEELEARKLEKKLREISVLEAKRDAGERLDVLQVKKLETRKELENHSVMLKVRSGYARLPNDKWQIKGACFRLATEGHRFL